MQNQDSLQWYICHTEPRGEKIAEKGLERLGFLPFLPKIQKLQQWSDRKKLVEFPLFGGYIFLQADIDSIQARRRILQAPKIVTFVRHHGQPAVVPSEVIRSVQILAAEWNDGFTVEGANAASALKEGDSIYIVDGPLKGVHGVLQQKKNFPRVLVFVESIGQGISFEVDMRNVMKTAAGE